MAAGVLGGGGGVTVYPFGEDFGVAESAPVATPANAVPGTGIITYVQTDGQFSKSAGKLNVPTQSVGTWGNLGFYGKKQDGSGFARSDGYAVGTIINFSARGFGDPLVWFQAASLGAANSSQSGVANGFMFGAITDLNVFENNTSGAIGLVTLSAGVDYSLWIVPRTGGGAFYIIQGGAWSSPSLLWIGIADTTATLYPGMKTNTTVMTMDKIHADLAPAFASDALVATSLTPVSSNGSTATMSADGTVEHTIVAVTGVTQELMVRRTDDNNCVIIRMDQGASTIKVYEKNAGVETEKTGGTTSQTWTNATSYRVTVQLNGTAIKTWVDKTSKNATSGSFNQTATGAKVSHAGTKFNCWPLVVPQPIPLL